MKKHFLTALTVLLFMSCKTPYMVTAYNSQQINDEQAKNFIEEMYYQGIPQKCTNVETTNESIKATFEYTTAVRDYYMQSSNSFANKNVEAIFFKQIQSLTLNSGQKLSTKGLYYVQIITRTNTYDLRCKNLSLAENFIDAVEHFRHK